MFLFAVAFLAGCVTLQGCAALPPLQSLSWWSAVALVIAIIVFRYARRVATVILGVALGMAWNAAHIYWQLAHDLPSDQTSNLVSSQTSNLASSQTSDRQTVDAILTGNVSSLVTTAPYGIRFEFDIETVETDHSTDQTPQPFPKRVQLTWYDATQPLQPGERWRLPVRLKPRHGFANPGSFDYEAQLFREGIGATGYVRSIKARKVNGASLPATEPTLLDDSVWGSPLLSARTQSSRRLALAFGESSQFVGIAQGLAVGDTSRINADQWRVFARTGTTHLMAISGLHIAMVALAVAALVGWCVRCLPLQRWASNVVRWQSVAGLSTAVMYSALAGFSIPTQRTLVMLCVYFLWRLMRRAVPPLHAMGLALLCVLIVDPFAPMSAGFWLSFGAVLAIMLSSSGSVRPPKKLAEFLRMQWAVTIGMLPLVLFIFGGVSLISPLVNLIAIPLFSFIAVPVALITTLLAWIHPTLAQAPAWLFEWLFTAIWPALHGAAQSTLATWQAPQFPLMLQVLLLLGCVLLVAPGLWFTRVVGVLSLVAALSWQPIKMHSGEFKLTLLDVGQGLSVMIQTRHHVLLYDAGPAFQSGRDTGESVVLPYLYSQGIRGLDRIVASHGDLDHIGGLQSVINAMPAPMFAGPSVAADFPNRIDCQRGQQWMFDDVQFDVIYPGDKIIDRKDNNSSCVLRISGRGGSAIVFGDIEKPAEKDLLARTNSKQSLTGDIIVVPHHGSRTSSTPELVAATHARFALVGVGADNRWGFPKQDVVARWRDAGASLYATDASGAVQIQVNRDGIHVPQAYREQHRRYWRR